MGFVSSAFNYAYITKCSRNDSAYRISCLFFHMFHFRKYCAKFDYIWNDNVDSYWISVTFTLNEAALKFYRSSHKRLTVRKIIPGLEKIKL